jgi:hypothetical protein
LNDLFGSMEEERSRGDSFDSLFGSSSTPTMKTGSSSKKSFSDLFGNSNDDNLFDEVEDSKMSLPQSNPAPQEKLAPVQPSMPTKRGSVKNMNASALYGEGLFDNDDEDADIFGGSNVIPKSSAPEKNKNLANLFGGDDDEDLFATSKKPASQPTKKPPTKPTNSDLFGGDGDDDDSLFGAKKTSTTAKKPEVKPIVVAAAVKKAAASDLFGDNDDDDDLFGSKTKSKINAKGETPVAKPPALDETEPEVARPKSAALAGAQASAFALAAAAMPRRPPSDDDEDEETTPKHVVVAKVTATAATPVVSSSTPVKKTIASDLFGGDDDDDDSLFGSKKTASVPKPEVNPIVVVPIEVKPEPLLEKKVEDPIASPPVSSPSATLSTKRPVSNKLASRMSGLDPTKIIMPGMAPPPKFKKPPTVVAEESEGNETPSEAPLGKAKRTGVVTEAGEMVNVTLDRATVKKAAGKSRKAPSRKKTEIDGDTLGALLSGDVDSSVVPEPLVAQVKESIPESAKSTPPAPLTSGPVSKTKDGGLFGDDGEDGLFSSSPKATPVTVPVAAAVVPLPVAPVSSKIGLFGDDEPSSLPTKTDSVKKATPVKSAGLFGDEGEDSLFGGSKPLPAAHQVARVEPTKATTKGGLFGDDSDDPLFGGAKPKGASTSAPVSVPAPTPVPVKSEAVKAVAAKGGGGLFGDDDGDDVFGAPKPTPKPAPAVSTKPAPKSLFGDDDGDDLFSSSRPAAKSVVAAKAVASKSSLFGDDDDDLFGSTKPKATATKSAAKSLFDD